jgi:pimeloyl-ACP methyl ester carboxylesterase
MQIKPRVVFSGVLIHLSFLFAGCVSVDYRGEAKRIARASGLNSEYIAVNSFPLATWSRFIAPVTSIRVYIEGDGFAWRSRQHPSDDPTPHQPTGLRLAAADPQANVLYLARPCQFIATPLPGVCEEKWWTSDRFAPPVIDAMNEGINLITRRYPSVKLDVVGYSGGGNIAALLASRPTDVQSLRTVAGNLDVDWVNRLHDVTPMPNALSAIHSARQLHKLPQLHFSGGADEIVPAGVARRFKQAVGGRCVRVKVVEGMAHGSDWGAIWSQLLREEMPGCQ